MPPTDKSDQSVIRYLTRLLAAQALDAGGVLRISLKSIRQIESEGSRQMLCEDTDIAADELVLRFGSKHSAVYPVEPESCASPKPQSPTQRTTDQNSSPSVTLPKTVEELQKLERTVKARKAAAILLSAQRQRASSNPSELNFPDLEKMDEQMRGQT